MKFKKLVAVAASLSCFLVLCFGNVAVAKQSPDQDVYDVTSLVPDLMKGSINIDRGKLTDAAAYGLLETVGLVMKDSSSEIGNAFHNGNLTMKHVVPIYDADDALSEVMIVFNAGYVIVDADNGELLQYSYGQSDLNYFQQADRIYAVAPGGHFSVRSNTILDGSFKKQDIRDVKKKFASPNSKKIKEKNAKWGQLDAVQEKNIFLGWSAGSNEGTSRNNTITNEYTWMYNFYGGVYDSYSTTLLKSKYISGVSNINQNNYATWISESNDCALASTLEIMGYFWSLTDAQRKTAYNAIVGSSYYSSSGGGVGPTNNDQIFKVGAEAIGKPVQQTSDDPEQYMNINNFDFVYDWLTSYGPFYWSMTQDPYGGHTVTVKGADRFQINYKKGSTYYVKIEEFMVINDHWEASGTSAYLNIKGLSTLMTYATAIKVN